MKRTVLFKTILAYLIFLLVGYGVIFYYASGQVRSFYIKQEARSLYKEATTIASTYATDYYSSDISLTDLHSQLTIVSSYLNAPIQVINTSGTIVADSSTSLSDETFTLTDFDPTASGSNLYEISHFYSYYTDNRLNVLAPITVNYKVRGYIAIHKPLSTVLSSVDKIINIIYRTFMWINAVALIALLYFIFAIYLPLRKITRAAMAYTDKSVNEPLNLSGTGDLQYLAASLNYMFTELSTLEDDQRKFISNVSHDFRSPLTSIQGYVNAILDGTIPYEMQDKYLKIVVGETERLTKLTQNLLDLNQIGSKTTIMDISSFDLNEVIKSTVATFEGRGREKDVSVELILTDDTMFVSADKGKIQQVLHNLIDNAMKFSHEHSVIRVETTVRNEKVYTSVKDTGIGIPKDSINKIWDRFYKTDQSRGKDKKGTGLGLAIVKEIITAHDENITVVSTENVGTEFTFSLSLTQNDND